MYRWFSISAVAFALLAFVAVDGDAQKKKPPIVGNDPIHDPANAVKNLDVHPELEATLFAHEDVGPNVDIDNGGLTMPDALDKQLGLKLDSRKLPMPVTVIDHIERPSDN